MKAYQFRRKLAVLLRCHILRLLQLNSHIWIWHINLRGQDGFPYQCLYTLLKRYSIGDFIKRYIRIRQLKILYENNFLQCFVKLVQYFRSDNRSVLALVRHSAAQTLTLKCCTFEYLVGGGARGITWLLLQFVVLQRHLPVFGLLLDTLLGTLPPFLKCATALLHFAENSRLDFQRFIWIFLRTSFGWGDGRFREEGFATLLVDIFDFHTFILIQIWRVHLWRSCSRFNKRIPLRLDQTISRRLLARPLMFLSIPQNLLKIKLLCEHLRFHANLQYLFHGNSFLDPHFY